MNSPLELRKVRLRDACADCTGECRERRPVYEHGQGGFPGRRQCAGEVWIQRGASFGMTIYAMSFRQLKSRSVSAAIRDGACRFPSGGFARTGRRLVHLSRYPSPPLIRRCLP